MDIVGLADGAVKESRERMRAAIKNSGLDFPSERVLISLSPADLKKEGAGFDLAIALAVLKAHLGSEILDGKNNDAQQNTDSKENFANNTLNSILIMGELELSGNIRQVKAVHAAAATAAAQGIRYCIVPSANANEAREVEGMKVFAADTLTNALYAIYHPELFSEKDAFKTDSFTPDNCIEESGLLFPLYGDDYEFSNIKNQAVLVRALEIAAAGGHNVLAVGAPGCGKTMALQKFPALLPLLSLEDAKPVTRIYSVAGLMSKDSPLIRTTPFRMPHQTASIEGMCGGGPHCSPGEISLAHNGVLFLDEAAEFRSSVLQMLRVPLETGRVTLARAGRSSTYPASFQLLMAANPCPCGNFGSETKMCLCSARSVELYWKKFSAPLLDRIDIRVSVNNSSVEEKEKKQGAVHKEMLDSKRVRNTNELRKSIARAIQIAQSRQGKRNAKLLAQDVATFCPFTKNAKDLLEKSSARYGFSPRGRFSCIKLSRTIADLEKSDTIHARHIEEAVFYRKSFNDFFQS